MKISRATKMIAILAACFAMVLTPICTYAAPQQTAVVINTTEINTAIANKDYKPIYREFVKYYGDYFRLHYMEDNFPYFNVYDYMKKYPDVAKAMDYKPDKVLEHYLNYGIYEERSGCGKYDIGKYLRKNPSTILSADFANNVATPEKYFEANQTKIVEANTEGGTTSGGGGGSSSGGYTPSPSPTVSKTFTMMYYFGGADLEEDTGDMTKALIDTVLALYGNDTGNVNYLVTLGGADSWKSTYLNGLLGKEDGDETNTTGWFAINMDEVTKVLDAISESTKIPVTSMYDAIHNGDDEIGSRLLTRMYNELFTEDTLPSIKSASKNAALGDKETLTAMLDIARSRYYADNYGLSFSGHGGGSLSGACTSSDKTPILQIADVATALKNAGFTNAGTKLSLLVYDACMMGSMETANALKDYYEYFYGSETFQRGDINYYNLTKSVVQNINDSDVAKKLAYAVFSSRSAYQTSAGDLQTAAIFNSEEANNAVSAVNNLSMSLMNQIEIPENAEAIYMAMKKASVRCYQMTGWNTRDENYNYFDLKDYLEHLQSELHNTEVRDACMSDIQSAIDAIDKFSEANSYNYDGVVVYNSQEGGLINSSKKLWEEYLHYNFCGANIMFPSYEYTTSIFDDDTAESRLATVSELIQKDYIDKYKDTGLDKYCSLLEKYIARFVSKDEFDRVTTLSEELTNGSKMKYEQLATVTMTEDNKAVRVMVKAYETDSDKPDHSSGDAYLDLMDTARSFTAYLTRMVSVKTKTGGEELSDPVSIVFAEKNIDYMDVDGENNGITVILKELIENTVVNYAVGTSTVATEDDSLDMLLKSSYDADSWKEEILKNLNIQDYSLSDYQIYAGYCDYTDSKDNKDYRYPDVVHFIFKKSDNSDNQYNYYTTVSANNNDGKITFSELESVYGITFAHYYVDDASEGTDILKYFESRYDITYDNNGIYMGYGEEEASKGSKTYKYYYFVNDNNTVAIKNTKVSTIDSDATHNGYNIEMVNLKDGWIDLNQVTTDTGTTHDPAHDDNYSGLITIGEAGEIGYVETMGTNKAVCEESDASATQPTEESSLATENPTETTDFVESIEPVDSTESAEATEPTEEPAAA